MIAPVAIVVKLRFLGRGSFPSSTGTICVCDGRLASKLLIYYIASDFVRSSVLPSFCDSDSHMSGNRLNPCNDRMSETWPILQNVASKILLMRLGMSAYQARPYCLAQALRKKCGLRSPSPYDATRRLRIFSRALEANQEFCEEESRD